MTYKEIVQLEKVTPINNDDSLIQLIELYCTDYTKICADNAIGFIYLQSFKLLWTNLKKYLPELSKVESVLQAARTFKTTPNRSNFKKVINILRQESVTFGESVKTLSRLVTGVFVEISKHLNPFLDQSFGRYANTSIATGLISGYVADPSYKSFSDMIDRIESFGQSHNEIYLAKELLLDRFAFYEKDISKFKGLEDRCAKIAQLTGTSEKFLFLQKLLSANEGNVHAMLEVGEKYERGIGITSDVEEAEKWYRKALMEGHPNAQFFINNLYTKQHLRQIEEQNKRQLSEQQKILEKLKRELRYEREKTLRLEQERLNEIKRHNLEIENLKQQLAEAEKTRLMIMSTPSHEEDNIEVFFRYKLHSWNGDIIRGDKISKIAESTYNSLITGGKQAIISFVTGLKGYMRDGEYIFDASMSRL